MTHSKLPFHWQVRPRLVLSICTALVVSILVPNGFTLSTRLLCIWNAGMIVFLISTWLLMLRAEPKTVRRNAKSVDEGGLVILSLIITAACASILAIAFMLKETKGNSMGIILLHVILAITTIIGSWLLVHTVFAMHYARKYYQDEGENERQNSGGLDFPEDIEPDYWDFLYFAFVIGMTSQVSDVQITSRSMRRLSLLHGTLSFFFNTAIVAMSINIIAGLI